MRETTLCCFIHCRVRRSERTGAGERAKIGRCRRRRPRQSFLSPPDAIDTSRIRKNRFQRKRNGRLSGRYGVKSVQKHTRGPTRKNRRSMSVAMAADVCQPSRVERCPPRKFHNGNRSSTYRRQPLLIVDRSKPENRNERTAIQSRVVNFRFPYVFERSCFR